MITGITESKTLTKHISSQWKCRFDGRKCNSDQSCNNNNNNNNNNNSNNNNNNNDNNNNNNNNNKC